MPRIRTVKPEFFRSPSTAKASPLARLLYEAMWCWADDFGIGETNVYGLLGFAFPDSDHIGPEEIPRLLKEVQRAYEVEFYECRGRYFYAVKDWEKHQKTERRSAKRNPTPDDPDSCCDMRFYTTEEIPRQSGGTTEQALGKSPIGTGEQGNREQGNREQGGRATMDLATRAGNPPALAKPPPPDYGPNYADAMEMVATIIGQQYPARARGLLVRYTTELLNEDKPREKVEITLRDWKTKQLHPSQLPMLYSDVINRENNGRQLSAVDQKYVDWQHAKTPERQELE